MYEVFYKLAAEPFRLSPDHRFCFEHKSYSKAYAYMTYAFRRAEGFVMITGRPGTGKTTLIGDLVDNLARERVNVAHLVCTQLQADDLLRSVAYSFGIESTNLSKAELLQRLTQLLNRWQKENRRALLAVDEAQDLSPAAMEELRLLTNIQQNGQPLLQVFLLGQPELRDLILAPEMEQVHQRIVAASHIEGLELDETESYVMHRLQVVRWKGDPAINRAIFPLIHKFSDGIPRRINLICSRLFLLGSVEERHSIDVRDVGVVIRELQGEGLAAGTGFSAFEFDQPASNDWVAPPVETPPPVQPESPRAVEGAEPAAVDLGSRADEKKKNRGDEAASPDAGGTQQPAADEHVREEPGVEAAGAHAGDPGDKPGPAAYRESATAPGENDAPPTGAAAHHEGGDGAPAAAMELDEGAQVIESASSTDHAPADQRSILWRVSNWIIPVILVLALLIFARDLVPPDVAKRLAGMAGLEEFAWLISSEVERGPIVAGNTAAATGFAAEDVIPGADLTRGAGLDATASNTALEGAGPDAAGEPVQDFYVQFEADSELLDYDAWMTLDRAAALLRAQPEVFGLVVYRSGESLDRLSNLELAQVRISTIEQYLETAGVNPARLRLENALALELDRAAQDLNGNAGRFIQISIGSGAVE
jgi:type II secretory pathway predicted ATPase ExeA